MMINWICDHCGRTCDSRGWLWVDLTDVGNTEAAQQQWNERHSGDEPLSLENLLDMPVAVPWKTCCAWCFDEADESEPTYAIALDRIPDHRALLRWTAHLASKTWISVTDWIDLIELIAAKETNHAA